MKALFAELRWLMRPKVLDFSDPQASASPYSLELLEEQPSFNSAAVLGRTGEWRLLQRLWQQALSGHAKSFLLLGDSGLGKTHLLKEWTASLNAPTLPQEKHSSNALVLWLDAAEWRNTQDMQAALKQQWQQWAWAQWRTLLETLQALPSPQEQAEPNLDLGWTPERMKQAQHLVKQAPSEGDALQALASMINELWKPTLSFWQRWGFSPQAYAEQVYQVLNAPQVLLAQQVLDAFAEGQAPKTNALPNWPWLKGGSLPCLILIDHWESLARLPVADSKALQTLLENWTDHYQQPEQRTIPILWGLCSRTEHLSQVMSAKLFGAFRSKILLEALPAATQNSLLTLWNKTSEVQLSEEAQAALQEAAQGNLEALALFHQQVCDLVLRQQRSNVTLDDVLALEPLTVHHVLALSFSRAELFLGQHGHKLKEALVPLFKAFYATPFSVAQAASLLQAEKGFTEGQAVAFLKVLFLQGFLATQAATATKQAHEPNEPLLENEPLYAWGTRLHKDYIAEVILPYSKTLADSRLKQPLFARLLPLSILSAELDERQIQHMLQLAGSEEEAELLRDHLEEQLLAHSRHREVRVRLTVLQAMAVLKSPALLGVVLAALQDEAEVLREAALTLVERLASWWQPAEATLTLQEALSALLNEACPVLRHRAFKARLALALRQVPLQASVFNLLEEALSSEQAGLRALAYRSLQQAWQEGYLSQLPSEAASLWQRFCFELLGRFKEEPEPFVRNVAYALLALLLKEGATAEAFDFMLNRLQQEPDPACRKTLVATLSQVPSAPLLDKLAELMLAHPEDLDENEQLALIKALGKGVSPNAETYLLACLDMKHPPFREHFGKQPAVLWMLLRSLGLCGKTQEALLCLQQLESKVKDSSLLLQALRSSLRQVATRLEEVGHATALLTTSVINYR
jgi:hypothetical protein